MINLIVFILCDIMEKNNSNYSPDSRYLLNFSFSQKRLSSKDDGQTLNFQAFS